MLRNPLEKRLMTSVLIMLFLLTALNISFSPTMTVLGGKSTSTVTISPQKGHVGDVVSVTGEINTTDGAYLLFFDGEKVKDGTATGTEVNETFVVPPRPKGNYTVTLRDVTLGSNYTSTEFFAIQTAYFVQAVLPSPPEQLQEGHSTEIWANLTGGARNTSYLANVTVTDPLGTVFYNDTLRLTNTTDTGYGEGNLTYPADFAGGAHTNFTGAYPIALNSSLANASFTVGLTNKLEYQRTDHVTIQGAGYKADENVTVSITVAEDTVAGYPQTEKASADGLVTHRWEVPDNATLGIYSVTLTSAITEKPIPDTQTFAVTKIESPLLNQTTGIWEDAVNVIGEIETFGGDYSVLWDNESIRDGTCAAHSGVVNETFNVPLSVSGAHEIAIYDKTNKTASPPVMFNVTTSCSVSVTPGRIHEGENATITVSVDQAKIDATYAFLVEVVAPTGQSHDIILDIAIEETSLGEDSVMYWGNFTGAKTDYVGTYTLTATSDDKTLATGDFTVALTDKPKYARRYLADGRERTSEVFLQGSGYTNETVIIDITHFDGLNLSPVESLSINATDGIVTHTWKIPENATLGVYNVTLTGSVTHKPVQDIQKFTVFEIVASCQAQNKFDNQPLAEVTISTYLGAIGFIFVGETTTNETGWADFLLDEGNYSFAVYWKGVEVARLNFKEVAEDDADFATRIEFYLGCELARFTVEASDERGPLPFISVTLRNTTHVGAQIPVLQTDYDGIASTNVFTNVSYRIEARRYGNLFLNRSIGTFTATPPLFNVECPTYTLFVHVMDSKELPMQNRIVEVTEWSSGRIAGEGRTSLWGSIRVDVPFGRYRVRVYDQEEAVVLNETVVDVLRNQFYLVFNCRTVNLDLSVKVVDLFGQPVPNALVKIEREGLESIDLETDGDGVAAGHGILGGDLRISLYVAGRLEEVEYVRLDESREILFQVGDYVMVGGYTSESSQLITGVSLTVLFIALAVALFFKRHSKE